MAASSERVRREPTPGAKMMYLIRRKPGTSREELVAHWFANHMPGVIQRQTASRDAGRLHAWRYIATLFDAGRDGRHVWDGVAQLWFDEPLRRPRTPHGSRPADTFQQKAEPYVPWATREFVIVDGSERLPVEPLTLNEPFPCTRSGFFKLTYLVPLARDADPAELFEHWLTTHADNVARTLRDVGGFRYVISLSIDPQSEPWAGMAELYFPDVGAWRGYRDAIEADGMEKWVDAEASLALRAGTEMIGIP